MDTVTKCYNEASTSTTSHPSSHQQQRNRRDLFCDSQVGSILHVVQTAGIFKDSKTFVDMKMLRSPAEIEQEFQAITTDCQDGSRIFPSKDVVADFVLTNFTHSNQMETHFPKDWKEDPKIVARIADTNYSNMASVLNERWNTLCRKINPDVQANPDRYSLLYLPHPVVVPGGRFREIYYWDSYWVIRGLIQSEMYETVKGILFNFVLLIKDHGFIPNGGRSYYLNRSQPPMFIQMVQEYVQATNDVEFLRENIQYLEDEYNYWHQKHSVTVLSDDNGGEFTMFRYNCEDDGPRPESYIEDFQLVEDCCQTDEEKSALYHELKTGAETGWDYSSRWFVNPVDSSNNGGLNDTKARSIIPVDLNSIMAKNAEILADFCRLVHQDNQKSEKYLDDHAKLVAAIEQMLWNDEEGVWFDFDLSSGLPRKYFSPSNVWPLWASCYDATRKNQFTSRAVQYLKNQNLDAYEGGVPTTLLETGQQWDFPNCWPPLEHMMVKGLNNCDTDEAKEIAYAIAAKRVHSCYLNFVDKGHMFEKYDATSLTRIGGGGEYEVQLGFGWTNGVVLDFLDLYHERLTSQKL